jgi:hypothetical protein
MHKAPIPIAPDIRPAKPRRPLLRKAAMVLVGISLAPLVAEGTSICYAQWSQVMGTNTEARTPVLDSLFDGLDSGRQSCSGTVSSVFQHTPWNHQIVLGVAVVLVIVGVGMLKY